MLHASRPCADAETPFWGADVREFRPPIVDRDIQECRDFSHLVGGAGLSDPVLIGWAGADSSGSDDTRQVARLSGIIRAWSGLSRRSLSL